MWYEILPTVAIIGTMLVIPPISTPILNWLIDGVPYKRDTRRPRDVEFVLRDIGLTGNPYKHLGLENVPDMK